MGFVSQFVHQEDALMDTFPIVSAGEASSAVCPLRKHLSGHFSTFVLLGRHFCPTLNSPEEQREGHLGLFNGTLGLNTDQ